MRLSVRLLSVLLFFVVAGSQSVANADDETPSPEPDAALSSPTPKESERPHAPFSLPGVAGVKWGESQSRVYSVLSRKYKKVSDDESGVYFSGQFAGYSQAAIVPYFKLNKLYLVKIAIFSQEGKTAHSLFFDVTSEIHKKYGPSDDYVITDQDRKRVYQKTQQRKYSKSQVDAMDRENLEFDAIWYSKDGAYIEAFTDWFRNSDPRARGLFLSYSSNSTYSKLQSKGADDL